VNFPAFSLILIDLDKILRALPIISIDLQNLSEGENILKKQFFESLRFEKNSLEWEKYQNYSWDRSSP